MPKGDGALAVGVDIGGTKVEIVLAARTGERVAEVRIPTHDEMGPAGTLAAAAAAARQTFGASLERAVAVGVSVAGQVGPRGVLLGAPNLEGWAGAAMGELAGAAFSLPAAVVNDVRAATWGEWKLGAGRRHRDLVVLFLGTGVGGGAVIGGRMLEGSGGVAGEFGHVTIVAGGRQCTCGNRGCLEAYCGGWALAERARDAVHADPAAGAALLRLAGGDPAAIAGETLAAALREGDPLAATLMTETAEALGAGMTSLVNALNPRRVILGGGIMDGFPELLARAEALVRSRALPAARSRLTIVRAALGDDAPALGAASVAFAVAARRRPRPA